MENYIKEFYISRIRCGFVDVDEMRVFGPTPQLEYESNKLFMKVMRDYEDLMSEEDALKYLINIGQWSEKEENEFSNILEKHIEYWKVEIYNSTFKSNTKEIARAHLRTAEKHFAELAVKRAALESYTKNGIASFCRNMFLFANSATYIDGSKIDWSGEDLISRMNAYFSSLLPLKEIRELARTSPWTGLWSTYRKSNIQIFESKNLNTEQLNIIQWSSLYDNIQESSECPTEDIVADDDALDGWLIIQRRKRESAKNSSAFENQNKASGHTEQFIIAESKKDIERIQSLNSPQSLSTMKSRLRQVEKHGILKEAELADVKQSIMMKSG